MKGFKLTIYGVGSEKCKMVKSKFPESVYVDIFEHENTRGVRQAKIQSVLRGGEWPIIFDNEGHVSTYV